MFTATTLADRQTRPASTTSRQSCSNVRQVRTRNMAIAPAGCPDEYRDQRFISPNVSQRMVAWLSGRKIRAREFSQPLHLVARGDFPLSLPCEAGEGGREADG